MYLASLIVAGVGVVVMLFAFLYPNSDEGGRYGSFNVVGCLAAGTSIVCFGLAALLAVVQTIILCFR